MQRLHVPQTAGALLEVRLQHLRDRARPQPAERGGIGELVDEPGAPFHGQAARVVDQALGLARERTPDDARRQERGQRVEVVRREAARLLDRPGRVPEHESGVPQRVPERVGEGGDVAASVVEQQDVDIRARTQLAACVRPQRDQRDTVVGVTLQHVTHRVIDDVAQRVPERHPTERPIGDQRNGARHEAHSAARVRHKASDPPRRCGPGRRLDGRDPHLAVADLAGARRLDDRLHDRVGLGVVDEHLDAHLRDEVDLVLGAAVHLGVAALAPEALDLGDGEALDAVRLQRILHVVERNGLTIAVTSFMVLRS